MSEYRLIPLSGKHGAGLYAKVSPEDYEYLSQFTWHFNGYAYRQIYKANSAVTVYMHRLVIAAEKGQKVDHKNCDRLDNRRENLRLCTNSQNSHNSLKVVGKSQFKGVSWDKGRKLWFASVRVDGKRWTLGRYAREEDAARAYDQAALFVYGAFATPNFPDSEPLSPTQVRAKKRSLTPKRSITSRDTRGRITPKDNS